MTNTIIYHISLPKVMLLNRQIQDNHTDIIANYLCHFSCLTEIFFFTFLYVITIIFYILVTHYYFRIVYVCVKCT